MIPLPIWLTAPVPVITLATVSAAVRLNCRVALFVTVPVPNWPAAPPAPRLSVPAEMVVVPL